MSAQPVIKTLLFEASERLAPTSDSPRADAEILLAHVLGKGRTYLFAWPEKQLEPEQESLFLDLIARRQTGEPIAYLTGTREFWSREFLITPDVLIPRPETELLVELALDRIPQDQACVVADLGAGSGAIAVTVALERPKARVWASDISGAALAVAKANAERQGARNVEFVLSDWLDGLPPLPYDLIVSNPPYIAEHDPHLAEGDLRFEPTGALASGPDGLDAIRRIAADARGRLKPGGALLLEHGYDQAEAVQALLCGLGYRDVASHRDLLGHGRVTLGLLPPSP
ncbi:peptide chain release factor N(5)-glutamine methyltransferase [Methylogaea oryzae]|uniref:Release factor glutamine methyltransferase n=2 Tax=Methylogaea oryzae TaxID=1295382 RepID=A0A8D4VNF0_9GAMM|nr:peptide chain release factor N(5)-glutamine methyltransferase [Methylogaea oryzae]BBL69754.1 release factor glutamine methyltransferase [Methylogaea oryzae]